MGPKVTVFAGAVLVIATTATAVAIGTGCAEDAASAAADAGAVPPAPDAQRPPSEDDASPPTCPAVCEVDHANGLVKDRTLVACWETHCKSSCIDRIAPKAPQSPDAGEDAGGDAGEAAPSCGSAVVTVNDACSRCTRERCCAAWDACFQDTDCTALNRCYQACAP